MPDSFHELRYHVSEGPLDGGAGPPAGGATRGVPPPVGFSTDEAAARHYLTGFLGRDARPGVRGLSPPGVGSDPLADMRTVETDEAALGSTSIVKFEQTRQGIPVFGSTAVVELDGDRKLVSIEGQLADLGALSATPTVQSDAALTVIAGATGVDVESLRQAAPSSSLVFFLDEDGDGAWHLAHLVRNVPAAPANTGKARGHGIRPNARRNPARHNYLVDAHTSALLFHYSATPTLTKCTGTDELGRTVSFYAEEVSGGFELSDELRGLKTYDHHGRDIDASPPTKVLQHDSAQWKEVNPAAVSAHASAAKMADFLANVLKRSSIDGKGTPIRSVVNCTYAADEPPPVWSNAIWWNDRMWYGQTEDGSGKLRSFARYLDIIAHEMTHGVTEHTADLVYKNMSGALNESFSDIFGVVVANLYADPPRPAVADWDWQIGRDMNGPGKPLRDMSNPEKTGDPDHMKDYLKTTDDEGGVHTNSNIHNKAAFFVLTAKKDGKPVFDPGEVAVLYYLALRRLAQTAKFRNTLGALLSVTRSFFAGDPDGGEEKVKTIRDAYGKVGIEYP